MKRRNFFSSLAGLFSLLFIPKAKAEDEMLECLECKKPFIKGTGYTAIHLNRRDETRQDRFFCSRACGRTEFNRLRGYQVVCDPSSNDGEPDYHSAKIFPTDYNLTPTQEQEMVEHAMNRLKRLESEMAV